MSRHPAPKDEAAWVDTMFGWIAAASAVGIVGVIGWMAWMLVCTNY